MNTGISGLVYLINIAENKLFPPKDLPISITKDLTDKIRPLSYANYSDQAQSCTYLIESYKLFL